MDATVATPQSPTDPLLGVVLAERYQVLRMIGQGGMGVVYEAAHTQLNKRVAVKLLLAKYADDPEAIARFHREALACSQIGNPHIIDVIDIGTSPDGRSFVVLELLQGENLGDAIAKHGAMPGVRAIRIMQQVLQGIGAAHARGIIHRDLKPDNVFLIQRSNERDFVKLLDFGISKILDAADSKVRLTSTGTVVGTPVYMAPEQALGGAIDHRIDLYAAGVMFYEMLSGKPPFDAPSYLALITKHLHDPPPDLAFLRPDLPAWLVACVHRALEKDPDRRFASAAAFLAAMPAVDVPLTEGNLHSVQVATLPMLASGIMPLPANAPLTRRSAGPHRNAAPLAPSAQPAPLAPMRRDRTQHWLALGSAASIAVFALTYVVLRHPSEASREGTDAARARQAATLPTAMSQTDAGPLPETTPSAPLLEPTTGAISVESQPAGARVFVDDVAIGTTPLDNVSLPKGRHAIRLELAGYLPLHSEQTISAGETLALVAPLAPQTNQPTRVPAQAPNALRITGRTSRTASPTRTTPTPATAPAAAPQPAATTQTHSLSRTTASPTVAPRPQPPAADVHLPAAQRQSKPNPFGP